ncbi:HDOD domain-containing protein [Arhodomonas sp. AD133]|uniref:HDOD domain-containing protein n=1 Tax=Arhodomonas sp. AD133 TaxID=3415009 RepID=UPI003EC0E975
MSRVTARDCAIAARDLPSPPIVFQRLSEVLARPDWNMQTVAGVIASDPGVAARTLRLANSPFFGLPRQVETLEEAASIVGLAELRQLVLATSVIDGFKRIPQDLASPLMLREGAVRSAVLAAAVARCGSLVPPRRAFLGGLLHDVGSVVVCSVMAEQAREVLLTSPSDGDRVVSLEQRVFGTETCEVGGALLRHWRLPEALEAMVRFWPAPADEYAPDAALVVHLGVTLAVGCAVPGRDAAIWHACRVDPESAAGLVDDSEPEIERLLGML